MINQTIIIEELTKLTSESDIISYLSKEIFLPSIAGYWLFQFILTLIIGMALVKEDRGKFWAIFVLTQLVGVVILFFIFVLPVIPQLISKIT